MRTVKQVAKASGVSVRALHHYDHIGLLKPDVGDNGYRYYGQVELLRLQHILFYRELGLPLAEIARILDDPAFDTRAALIDLRQRVDEEITQRRDLAQTIDRTLALLDAGEPVDERRLFYGVSPEKQAAWESEMVARFGGPAEAAIRDATAAMQSLSPTELLDFKAEIEVIHRCRRLQSYQCLLANSLISCSRYLPLAGSVLLELSASVLAIIRRCLQTGRCAHAPSQWVLQTRRRQALL